MIEQDYHNIEHLILHLVRFGMEEKLHYMLLEQLENLLNVVVCVKIN